MVLQKEQWTLVYANRDYKTADEFVHTLSQAQQRMGIQLGAPHFIEIQNNTSKDYEEGFRQIDPNETRIVVVLL